MAGKDEQAIVGISKRNAAERTRLRIKTQNQPPRKGNGKRHRRGQPADGSTHSTPSRRLAPEFATMIAPPSPHIAMELDNTTNVSRFRSPRQTSPKN